MARKQKPALATLGYLDHSGLKKRWVEVYGTEAPAGISQPLLRHAIAYRLQEKSQGGLRPATRQYLEKMLNASNPPARPRMNAKPGTRLLREWHGVTYEVIVLDQGVMFEGRRFQSLSQVARKITGVKWSGPVFFGLRRKGHG